MKADRLFFSTEINEKSLNEVKLHENNNQITSITAAGVVSNRDITISKSQCANRSVTRPQYDIYCDYFFIKRKKTKTYLQKCFIGVC